MKRDSWSVAYGCCGDAYRGSERGGREVSRAYCRALEPCYAIARVRSSRKTSDVTSRSGGLLGGQERSREIVLILAQK